MGLFSSETVVTVSTSVNRVIKDSLIPNAVKTGVVADLVAGDNQIVEHVQESLFNSLAIKSNQMYSWAKKNYVYGLPAMTYLKNSPDADVIKGVIGAIEGRSDITVEYAKFDRLNTLHFGWDTLVNSYGYDQHTNEIKTLSQQKGVPVYLASISGVIPESLFPTMDLSALDQWGTNPYFGLPRSRRIFNRESPFVFPSKRLPYIVDAGATKEAVDIVYCWMAGNIYKEERIRLPINLSQEEQNKSYFQVKYSYPEELPNELKDHIFGVMTRPVYRYFTYQENLGTYPELDNLYSPDYPGFGSFFPFIYFRFDKRNQADLKGTEAYKDSRKLCKFLNMDFDAVAEAINSNPGIGDVTQALFYMGVPGKTTNQTEMRYLFDFFYRAYINTNGIGQTIGGTDLIHKLFRSLTTKRDKISILFQDKKFKMSLGFAGIRTKYSKEKLGKVDDCFSGSGIETFKEKMVFTDLMLNEEETEVSLNTPYVWYKKQVSEDLCLEVKVYDPASRYYLGGSHVTLGNINDPIFLVPVDRSITKDYALPIREELYARSMHFVFNARKEQEVKWYQQEWFGIVLMAIAIVWTAFSMGSDGGAALTAATATAGAFALFILKAILISVVIKFGVKMVAKWFGAEFAMMLGIVLMAVAAYYGVTEGVKGAPWANQLLTASNGLVQEGMKTKMQGLQEEYSNFLADAEDKMDALKEKQTLLESSSALSPMIVWGESPSSFLNRTIHSGNIGTWGYDAITHYVDTSLALPTLAQTLPISQPLLV